MSAQPDISLPSSVHMRVCGAHLIADVSGAAYWPDQKALLCADLHFEKGSAFAARGQMLPPYDTRATLLRLQDAIARYRPECVIALGDSFHDLGADGRMAERDGDALASLVSSVQSWIWIEGNHDPEPPARFGGKTAHQISMGPLTLRHEPLNGVQPGEVAGHLHPCAKVSGRGRRVRRRCFATDGQRLILPAIGAYTGGLNVCDRAYSSLFDARPDVYMLGRDRVYGVPGAKLLPD